MRRTYCFIGDAQVSSNNPIYQQYGAFFIAMEVKICGKIVDAGCNAILPLTRSFIRNLLVGKNINDIDDICSDVEQYYHGSSQRGIKVALRDAYRKYETKLKNK